MILAVRISRSFEKRILLLLLFELTNHARGVITDLYLDGSQTKVNQIC